jgi:hypothetical protein
VKLRANWHLITAVGIAAIAAIFIAALYDAEEAAIGRCRRLGGEVVDQRELIHRHHAWGWVCVLPDERCADDGLRAVRIEP